ncbi:MAG: peptidoglycan-binding protein [Candidatus Peribacteraceae bacterium]|nr:peptidoglycan-binding protein [Candidatus Peribacteraceae bacterium]
MDSHSLRSIALFLAIALLLPLTPVPPAIAAFGSSSAELPGDDDTEPISDCLVLTKNLRYRSSDARTDGEVSLLQDFLNVHGYLATEPTGFFSSTTRKAVKAFQKDVGLRPTGFVAAFTRKKISTISCGTTVPEDPPVSQNLPPVIDGLTAPSFLAVGELGTWTVNAHDPENRPLTYTMNWGDTILPIQPVSPNSAFFQTAQTATFTHTYVSAGTYTVQISVKDDGGNVQSASAVVNVTNTAEQGSLTVSLSSSNPLGDQIPKSSLVPMLNVDLVASCSRSVQVNGIRVSRDDASDFHDTVGVFAAVDGQRVTYGEKIVSNQTLALNFFTPLTLPACGKTTVTLYLDQVLSSTATPYAFSIRRSSDIMTDGSNVQGSFPLRGNTFKVAAVKSGQVTVRNLPISPASAHVGDQSAVIGRYELTVDTTEDQTLYTMTLRQSAFSSVADGDLVNIRVRGTDGGVLTNTASRFTNRLATVVFERPLTVRAGEGITLEAVANIVGGEGKTSQVGTFEWPRDIFAVGSLYGYGVNWQRYGSRINDDESAAPSTITIVPLQVAISALTITQQDLSGTDTARENAKNIRLMRFQARARKGQNILLTRIIVDSAAGDGTLRNGTNYTLWADTNEDGTVDTIIDNHKEATGSDAAGWTVTFDGIPTGGFVIPQGKTADFEVHSDIASPLQANPTLQLQFVTAAAYVEAEQLEDGTPLRGIETNGACTADVCQIAVTTAPSTLWNLVPQLLSAPLTPHIPHVPFVPIRVRSGRP